MSQRRARSKDVSPRARTSQGSGADAASPLQHWLAGRQVLIALSVLLVLGIVLRLMAIDGNAALIGASDSVSYLKAANSNVFQLASTTYPWPAGYPIFLNLAHDLTPNLSFAMIVQHLLGLGTAVLLFLTVRQVAPAAWALIPAAIVLLAGPVILLEHAVMTEALYSFLVAAMLYSAVRASAGSMVLWPALAGVLVATASCVRVAALPLVVVVAAWLLFAVPGDLRRKLTAAAVAILAALSIFGIYLAEMKRQTGFGGPALTGSGNYGTPTRGGPVTQDLGRVMTNLAGLWSSGDGDTSKTGYGYSGLVRLLTPQAPVVYLNTRPDLYDTVAPEDTKAYGGFLPAWERRTRLEGLPFLLLATLALVGVPFARGRRLATGILLLVATGVMLLIPIAYVYFDVRYVIPVYGVLGATAAIGAASLWERVFAARVGTRLVPRPMARAR